MGRRPVDLRSDTVTRPTPAMREAMARAEVGDDVWGEDPTVALLEERGADLLGLEASLFVPSGTMGNLIAVQVHTRPGDEVVVEERSHTMAYELAGAAAYAGVLLRSVKAPRGQLSPELVAPCLRSGQGFETRSALLVVENTHNMAGGTVLGPRDMTALVDLAAAHGIPVHLDGARLFNAAAALSIPVSELVCSSSSVMVSLSKGLGAPVGSLLAGRRELVAEARRVRKRLGGGMRQAGVLAAAGLVALGSMCERLVEDHAAARRLARGLVEIPGLALDADAVETNIVVAGLEAAAIDAPTFIARLADLGVLAMALGPRRVRFVTHYDVPSDGIERALDAVARVLGKEGAAADRLR